jgi:hypothetical protein
MTDNSTPYKIQTSDLRSQRLKNFLKCKNLNVWWEKNQIWRKICAICNRNIQMDSGDHKKILPKKSHLTWGYQTKEDEVKRRYSYVTLLGTPRKIKIANIVYQNDSKSSRKEYRLQINCKRSDDYCLCLKFMSEAIESPKMCDGKILQGKFFYYKTFNWDPLKLSMNFQWLWSTLHRKTTKNWTLIQKVQFSSLKQLNKWNINMPSNYVLKMLQD